MESDKEILVDNVREWIKIDEEIKVIQKTAREMRKRKKGITENLIKIMKKNEIEYLDVKNDTLEYTKKCNQKRT